jgi:hypothetical protein
VSRTSGLEQVNLLELSPVRIADWEEHEGRAVIARPVPTARGLRGLAARCSHALSARSLRLDDMGTFVWRRLDGATTVGEIVTAMHSELGGEQLEERVGMFIRALHREGFVGYPGWDEVDGVR